ncbi:ABC transporter ATP-binding protein [Sinomicrobium oceani]|uniref:ABC transporter ATP-binding protein n=1 Tax=Sinomicrobium oceani TaxID=1150368 RepID=UPI00227A89EB|nr:ABC transporter ATP-binding protein [Sinomicrobium oceani]
MPNKKVNIFSAFKTIIWPRRRIIFIGLLLILLSRIASFVAPISVKYLMDDVIPNKDFDLLKILVFVVSISIFVQAVSSFLLTKILSVQAQYLISELRAQVHKKVLSLSIRFFDSSKSGALVSRIMTDVEGVQSLIGSGLIELVGSSISGIVSFLLLLQISWSMTLFALVPLTVFASIALKAFKIIRPIFRNRGKINAEVTGRLTETLGGIRVIKGFDAENQENKIFEEGVDRLFQNIKKSLTATAFMSSLSIFILGIATVGIMGIGGYKVMMTELTIGEFLTFTFLLGLLVAPIMQLSNIGTQLTEALAGLDRTEELLLLSPESDSENRTIILNSIKGDVVFKNVSFAYEEDTKVLHNISFEVNSGSVVALVGSSGSGKSTIAGLIASFLNPQSGAITIDGKNLSKINLSSYRKFLGVVLQDEFLFEGSIRENILFPRPNATNEELQQAVKASYVDEFTNRFEDGLNTLIGERGVKLSGGQRQRIAIARAILVNPKILILDEATSNLDTESEALIKKSMDDLMVGRTTLIIAHRLNTIINADQILVIENGHIVESGKHYELLKSKQRYYDLFTNQARI